MRAQAIEIVRKIERNANLPNLALELNLILIVAQLLQLDLWNVHLHEGAADA